MRLSVGEVGGASDAVTQCVEVLDTDDHKALWLRARMGHFLAQGTLLIFVSTRHAAEALGRDLSRLVQVAGVEVLHGERDQAARHEALRRFKRGAVRVLVATDVASRGLDIASIATVVSYDAARRLDDHTHRIGCTGRAGAEGTAYTPPPGRGRRGRRRAKPAQRAAEPPPELLRLAMRSRRWESGGGGGGGGGSRHGAGPCRRR